MEFESVMEEELWDTIYYTKTLKDHTDLCIICQCDETEEGKTWSKTSLICGHVCHSRCYRRWCGVKRCLNCPICGEVQEIEQNRFCSSCNEFGHCDIYEGCLVIEKQIYEAMKSMEQ